MAETGWETRSEATTACAPEVTIHNLGGAESAPLASVFTNGSKLSVPSA